MPKKIANGSPDSDGNTGATAVLDKPNSARHTNAADPTTAPRLVMMPIDQINPSPLNPRKSFSDEQIQELAESIRQLGIQQPLVVRDRSPEGALSYDIIMGERRWRAAKAAGFTHVPCLLRSDVDDALHLELALHENIKRADLNPIEEARAFKQLQELSGLKQSEIGEKVGHEQATISKRISLLRLPEGVQDMIADGRLSAAHGVALLRYADFPDLTSAIAGSAAEAGFSTRDLEAEFGAIGPYIQDPSHKLFQSLGWEAPFKWQDVCQAKCPLAAFRKAQYGGGYCLRPDHYAQLVDEAKANEEAAMQAALAKAKAQKQEDQPGIKGAKVNTDAVVLRIRDLKHDQYKDLSYQSLPSTCTKDCECRAIAIDQSGKKVQVCLQPGKLQAKKNAITRDENKKRKEAFSEKLKQIESRLTAKDEPVLSYVAAKMFSVVLTGVHGAVRADVAEGIEDQGLVKHIKAHYYNNGNAALLAFAKLSLPELLALAGSALAREEIRQQIEYRSDFVKTTDFLLSAPKSLPGTRSESLAMADRVAIAQSETEHARKELEEAQLVIAGLKKTIAQERTRDDSKPAETTESSKDLKDWQRGMQEKIRKQAETITSLSRMVDELNKERRQLKDQIDGKPLLATAPISSAGGIDAVAILGTHLAAMPADVPLGEHCTECGINAAGPSGLCAECQALSAPERRMTETTCPICWADDFSECDCPAEEVNRALEALGRREAVPA